MVIVSCSFDFFLNVSLYKSQENRIMKAGELASLFIDTQPVWFHPQAPSRSTSPQITLKQRRILVKIRSGILNNWPLKSAFTHPFMFSVQCALSWLLLFTFIESNSEYRSHAGNVNLSGSRDPRHWKRARRTPLRHYDVTGWRSSIGSSGGRMGEVGISCTAATFQWVPCPTVARVHF